MRVIGGVARGRRLALFEGENIRPTTDRVREALFSMLYSRMDSLEGCKVLDVFAGSGALGIEALSRGASSACFIDSASQARQTIRQNLAHCGFADKARILAGDALEILPGLADSGPFELIFIDPPYNRGWAPRILPIIDGLELLAPGGLICLEAGSKESVPQQIGKLRCSEQRRYGSTMLHFFDRNFHE